MNHILLTIDVEDWFQVENFKQYIPFSTWPSLELRVEKNTHKLLDLLDSQQSRVRNQKSEVSGQWTVNSNEQPVPINQKQATINHQPATINKQPSTSNQIKATFFVLGWIAKRLPHPWSAKYTPEATKLPLTAITTACVTSNRQLH